jgi:peroxiredoxin
MDIALFLAIFAGISIWQSRSLVDSGDPAPQASFVDLDGEQHTFDDYGGTNTIVVFWAPWCGVCGAESDNISRVQSWLGDSVDVISVVLDYSSRAEIEDFIDEHEVDYPVLLGNGTTAHDFGVSSYPTIYFLSEDGRVSATAVGYTSTFGLLWRAML